MSDKHENFINGYDNITKPYHYNWHPSGIEAKEITDDLPRWIGDAITYIWRRNHKGLPLDDRRKALERLNECTPERVNTIYKYRQIGELDDDLMTKLEVILQSEEDFTLADAADFVHSMASLGWCRLTERNLQYVVERLNIELEELEKENN